ncbi:MAG: TatD family hydrolase [Planctomycetota bacterium]|jgi:predicted metal-dependent TIM-barrel fold hydrolase
MADSVLAGGLPADFPLIDPHIHMSARTTDDYQAMRTAGVVAVIEPAFWLGQPRTSVDSYRDYLSSLVGWERFRASQFGIKHYCTIGLNSKEANNEALAEAVLDLLPLYLAKDGVVAVGEIGFDDGTDLEERAFRAQLELAKAFDLPVQIHTPHRDKLAGTRRSMALCEEHGLRPDQVIIDHNTEQTVAEVLAAGYWAAFTIYPKTKMGNERMAAVVEQYGPERIIVDSSADWGISDPLAVPKSLTCYANALAAYGQSGRIAEADWADGIAVDQRQMFADNSILRGQQPLVEEGQV